MSNSKTIDQFTRLSGTQKRSTSASSMHDKESFIARGGKLPDSGAVPLLINNFPEDVFDNILYGKTTNKKFKIWQWSNVNDLGFRSRLVEYDNSRLYETLYFTVAPDSEIIPNIHQSSNFETLLSYHPLKQEFTIKVYPKRTENIKTFISNYIKGGGQLSP